MRIFKMFLILFFIALCVIHTTFDEVSADDTITIGEINTYSKLTSFIDVRVCLHL